MLAGSHHSTHVGDHVRLTTDLPKLGLHCGAAGSVCSTWFYPDTLFEVEFQQQGYTVRALLVEDQIEADDQPFESAAG